MKKILAIGLLAVGLMAVTQQEASAWVNTRFGMGLNFDWSSGGNTLLWGLIRDGQPGGADPHSKVGVLQRFQQHHQRPYYYPPQPQPQPAPGAPRSFEGPVDPAYGFQPQPFAPQGFQPSPFAPQGFQPTPFGFQSYQPMPYMAPGQFANYPMQQMQPYYYPNMGR